MGDPCAWGLTRKVTHEAIIYRAVVCDERSSLTRPKYIEDIFGRTNTPNHIHSGLNSEFIKSKSRTEFAKDQNQLTCKRSLLCRPRKVLPGKKLSRQAPPLYPRGIFRIKRPKGHQNLNGEMDVVNKSNEIYTETKNELIEDDNLKNVFQGLTPDKNNYSFKSDDHNTNENEDINEERNEKYAEEESGSYSTDEELENTNIKSTRKNELESTKYLRKLENYELPNIRKTIVRLQEKEILQRTQAIEAEFYERLIKLRKENETEVAKVMNRKNAELIAVQQAAELKHRELRQAIDKLENQLSDTVNNADQIKRSSEEKMNQLQSMMNKQFENLLKQSNEQREFLIQEHEKTLKELQSKTESTFKELEINKSLVVELESKMELQVLQLNKQKWLALRYKTLESKYNVCLEDHNQELKQIRSDHAKRICAMELERTNNEKQYETNLEKIKDEFNTKLKESRLSYERQLVSEVKEAETRGYEKCLLIKSDEITVLQKSIKETKESKSNDEIQNEKNQIIETLTNELNLSKLDVVKLEAELKEARCIALKEVELRREQLSEISLARELERKELISKHESNLNEEQCKNQETILRLQKQHNEELKTISSQANEKLIEIEREYKTRLKEANKRLNESQEKIINLDMILQKALQEKRSTQEILSESFQNEIEQMKNKQKEEVLILKEAISKERNRARLAEISLRQQEKAWNDMKTRWHEERTAQLGNSLPIEARTHMEATIEALRLQVNLLKKRITVMEEDRETSIIYPQKLQFSDQDVSLLRENSVRNESPVKDQPEVNQDNSEECKINDNSFALGDNTRRRIAAECTNSQTNLNTYPYKATCSEDWLLGEH
ncbi:hypothetical protein Smp_157130 [Schistosoma mansoni]|uniref:hypothetical protein n=1 Tax=Schistosoma mansoni TaxID=6183 RepID=UPI0001A630DB|nr:hypothetical protein Smp_157130 [Schistosoma mansoni]|eukprot:XP_018655045.1 hypothetical protein Smp_157130 [Schistosoma mansoni]